MGRRKTGFRSIDRRRRTLAGAATVALALGTVQVASSAADPAPVTQTFTCTGSEQGFSVPDGVTSLQAVAIGAPGATLSVGPNTGGRGAQVTANVGVTPGQFLRVNVGCPGSGAAGGFNGGGTANSALYGGEGAGGGGASDIRTISRFSTGTLESRLIVAGGGGGEGGTNQYGNSTSGGAGGNAGADGGDAGSTTNSRGRAGTLIAGGAGGSPTGTSQQGDPQPGSPGQAGTGGNGGAYGVNTPGRGGGGGGGGLFGGGGGGGGGLSAFSTSYGGGGGGGGSSLVPSGGTLTVAPAGTAPSVTITYVPPPADIVAPTVTVEQAAGQADPTSNSPITFTATFSEPVTGFDASDVDLSASTAGGMLSATVTDAGNQATYTVEVAGMSSSGDVVASIPADAASDGAGNPSQASTSMDDRVTYDEPPPPDPAKLSVVVSGHGAVHSKPKGIRCGNDCAEDYEAGTEVTLTARARRGSTFAGWGGACAFAGAAPTCSLILEADTEVSARFEP